MELIEAITRRKSVRAYKPDPVPKETLKELLETCLRAPSWANTQPWEFAIIGGKVMEELKKALAEKASAGEPPNMEISWPTFSGVYMERVREGGRRIFEVLGIAREDKQKRQDWTVAMTRFFDAPNGIVFYVDRSLPTWSILDTGILMQTIMLAALDYGLGTCPEAAVAIYPDILRKLLNIPESKLIVLGMAIGYPVEGAPINQSRSNRESLESFATWHGF